MLHATDRLTKTSRWVVRAARITNGVFLAAVLLGLLLSWIVPVQFAALLIQQPAKVDVRSACAGLRWLLVLGAAMAIAAEVLLAALAEMVASAAAGDPFVAVNARNLQTIGWALLALQVLDIPGALIAKFFPSLGSAAPDVTFSPAGWIAVLMVFVLSRVFATGSAMKDDLEGTV